MERDRHGQGLHDTHAERATSPAAKLAGYAAIAILLIVVVLLATGVLKMTPFEELFY